MFSVVLLNWKRYKNVKKIIQHYRLYSDDIIVWNNNPEVEFYTEHARCLNASEDLGLLTRFAACSLVRHPCVMIADDDLLLNSPDLLHQKWLEDPTIIHGIWGVDPKNDNTYGTPIKGDKNADIILTRCLMVDRTYPIAALSANWVMGDVLQGGKPYGNGEDILLSYAAQRYTARRNKVHALSWEELPAPHAIHGRWKGHTEFRTKIMRRCQRWAIDC